MLRVAIACTGAAGLTSQIGAFLGIISPCLAWSFTAFGAVAGLLYGIHLIGTSA